MRVAVVTPYHQETLPVLERACRSVAGQRLACTHVRVADGFPRPELADWPGVDLALPRAHGDNGNTPRHYGAMWAAANGFDAVAFLDADNWYDPEHIAGLVALHRQHDAPVVSARRRIWSVDGRLLLPEGEPPDGAGHNDTSTLLLTRAAFPLLDLWQEMPQAFSPICDTVFFYAALYRGYGHVWTSAVTVNFQSHYKNHYFRALVPAPDDNRVENAFSAAYGLFIASDPVIMAQVYMGRSADVTAWPPSVLGWRAAMFGAELTVRDKSGDGLKYLRQGCVLCPQEPAAANNLGAALARRGVWAEARRWLEQARVLAPGWPVAVHNAGLLAVMTGARAEGARQIAAAAPALTAADGSIRPAGQGYLVAALPPLLAAHC